MMGYRKGGKDLLVLTLQLRKTPKMHRKPWMARSSWIHTLLSNLEEAMMEAMIEAMIEAMVEEVMDISEMALRLHF